MTSQREKAERFLALHHGDAPLLMPNPWDVGSARILESLGFRALATTSSGYAGTLGRLDGQVTRDEALGHAADVAGAVSRRQPKPRTPATCISSSPLVPRTTSAGIPISPTRSRAAFTS